MMEFSIVTQPANLQPTKYFCSLAKLRCSLDLKYHQEKEEQWKEKKKEKGKELEEKQKISMPCVIPITTKLEHLRFLLIGWNPWQDCLKPCTLFLGALNPEPHSRNAFSRKANKKKKKKNTLHMGHQSNRSRAYQCDPFEESQLI